MNSDKKGTGFTCENLVISERMKKVPGRRGRKKGSSDVVLQFFFSSTFNFNVKMLKQFYGPGQEMASLSGLFIFSSQQGFLRL